MRELIFGSFDAILYSYPWSIDKGWLIRVVDLNAAKEQNVIDHPIC